MALNKKITADSGLATKYHKISNVLIDFVNNSCVISIDSYVTEDYRNKAKQAATVRKSITDLDKQIENANDIKLKEALVEKANQLYIDNEKLLSEEYLASTDNIILDYIPKALTYESFYNEIKKLETFKDAELI